MTAKTPVASLRAAADDDVVPDSAATAPGFKRRRDAVVAEKPIGVATTIPGPPHMVTTIGVAVGQSVETTTPRPKVRRWRATLAVIVAAAAITFAGAMLISSPERPAASAGASATDSAIVAAPPVAAPQPPSTPPEPPKPDERAVTTQRITAALGAFMTWSKTHAGAPCPAATILGDEVDDGWGHVLAITCTEQPANEIIGVISAGPDGTMHTADDIASWQLGSDVTEIARGTRWVTAAPMPAHPVAKTAKPTEPKPAEPKAREPDVEFDEHGLPISR